MARPVVLTLFLTHECNLRCSYCYVHDKRKETMPIEVGQKAIDLAVSMAKEKVQVSFFGGEPLLEWDALVALQKHATERCKERGKRLVFALTTNGLLLNEERLGKLVEMGVRVGFSIDGCREAQDATRCGKNGKSSFDETIEKLSLAAKAMPDLQTISVVDPDNVKYLSESVRAIVEAGCRRITLNPNWGGDWEDEATRGLWAAEYKKVSEFYLEEFRAGRPLRVSFIEDKIITRLKEGFAPCDQCDFGNLDFAVSTKGNIYPCERQVGADGPDEEDMLLGDVWKGMEKSKQRKIHHAVKAVPEDCRDCALNDRCANWCPCANMALTGEPGKPGGLLCWHEQTTIAIADETAAALYGEKNPPFLERFYS